MIYFMNFFKNRPENSVIEKKSLWFFNSSDYKDRIIKEIKPKLMICCKFYPKSNRYHYVYFGSLSSINVTYYILKSDDLYYKFKY